MSISESTISQSKNNCVLIPVSGLQRRGFPDLEKEIGFDPAALLVQLDYWIGNRGFERAGRRWFRISAKNISVWAFPAWGQRKVQREIQALHDADLIFVEYFDGPYTTPYIALNTNAITAKLKTIRVLTAPEKEPPEHDTVNQPPIQNATPPTCKTVEHLPVRTAAPAEKTPSGVGGSSSVSKEVIIFYPFTSTVTMPGIVINDDESEPVDAPPPTIPSIPPSTSATTHKKDTVSVPAEALGNRSKKILKRQRKDKRERESARSADRAKRGTSSLNGEKQVVVGEKTETIQTSGWDEFCEKLAEICGIDFEIEPGHIRAWASKIWKKGNNSQGYTIDDLDDFIVWWNTYDWRGAKNKTLPRPKQVVECIRQSYEHESTITRRELRARGFSPDESRYRYITGELASYITY